LGQALVSLGKFSEAELCYQQLIKIKSEKDISYIEIGKIFLDKEQWLKAATYLEISIRNDPDNFWAYHHLGIALCQLQQWQWATKIIQKAILLKPNYPWCYYHLATALEKQNHLTQASKNYRIFLSFQADYYSYARLGNILVQQANNQPFTKKSKMLAEAWQCYEQGIELNRDYLPLYYQALELQPDNSEILFRLAEAHTRKQEWEVAIIFYQMGFQNYQ